MIYSFSIDKLIYTSETSYIGIIVSKYVKSYSNKLVASCRLRYANKHKIEGAIRKMKHFDCLSYAPTSSGRTEKVVIF